MLIELCIYRCEAGRLPALLERFRTATLGLFARHGFRPVGFFTTVIGPSAQELHYLLEWGSLADRERSWAAFLADPDWITAHRDSERDGRIVRNASNQILAPTDFSPMR
ncbi:NIPSNAP family protein [Alterinioella nitratireducens]|uniref:NIPSNAP family protein n=1 Tax=Alterinioella nitratireducens TaxID=2735915 RepID=UPI001551DA63|nr:NIPSNAP family protein [Alterinioella nitratireducens]NPD21480.1 NIPSNAP family protein [Alterinioella nitratireducens]